MVPNTPYNYFYSILFRLNPIFSAIGARRWFSAIAQCLHSPSQNAHFNANHIDEKAWIHIHRHAHITGDGHASTLIQKYGPIISAAVLPVKSRIPATKRQHRLFRKQCAHFCRTGRPIGNNIIKHVQSPKESHPICDQFTLLLCVQIEIVQFAQQRLHFSISHVEIYHFNEQRHLVQRHEKHRGGVFDVIQKEDFHAHAEGVQEREKKQKRQPVNGVHFCIGGRFRWLPQTHKS